MKFPSIDPHERNQMGDALDQILAQLDHDLEQCWLALEGMNSLELDIREAIVEELALHRDSPGIVRLLRLLASSSDETTRQIASAALIDQDPDQPAAIAVPGSALASAPTLAIDFDPLPDGARAIAVSDTTQSSSAPASPLIRMARCLVTPINGDGRGWVVVSTSHRDQRRTAAFLCDTSLGIVDVFGDVEPESESAGALLEQVRDHAAAPCALDDPDLALGLLAGSLSVSTLGPSSRIADWLEGTLGRSFRASPYSVFIAPLDPTAADTRESISRCAQTVLHACPSWLDRSPLTFQLAEEISLREANASADPTRDSGAYRYLFEHRLIHRLELYRRMLWWMARLWESSNQNHLSRSALLLAAQLSNEQFAVPSHPFTLELTTRSLRAAQAQLSNKQRPDVS